MNSDAMAVWELKGVQRNPLLEHQQIPVDIRGKHGTVLYLDPRRIRRLPYNPRQKGNPGLSSESIKSLGRSIRAVGQRDTAKVCLTNVPEFDAQLFDGERRTLACLSEGLMLRVEVTEELYDDDTLLILSSASNFGHEAHTTPEIAYMVGKFRDMGMTLEQISDIFGKSITWVQQHANLLKLDMEVLNLLAVAPNSAIMIDEEEIHVVGTKRKGGRKRRSRGIGFSLAQELTDLPAEDQKAVAKHVVKHDMPIAQARRYIYNYRREAGKEKQTRRRPGEKFEALENLAGRTIEQFGFFEDMRSSDFRAFLELRSAEELRNLVREFDGLLVTLKGFRDTVSSVLKKA